MRRSNTSGQLEPRTNTRTQARIAFAGALVLAVAALATVASASPGAACAVCGKNLIKNPGAESGAGITAVDAFGAVPGWTNEAGQFGAASYAFPNGWFSRPVQGPPKDRGKNYFFGGTTTEAVAAKATIGKQTIKLPAAAAGRKATLSGWLGNYVTRATRRCGRSSPTRPATCWGRSASAPTRPSPARTWPRGAGASRCLAAPRR